MRGQYDLKNKGGKTKTIHNIFTYGRKIRKTLKRRERFLGTGRVIVEGTRISDNEQFTKCMYVSVNSINLYNEYMLLYMYICVCVKHYIYTHVYNIYIICLKDISGYPKPAAGRRLGQG